MVSLSTAEEDGEVEVYIEIGGEYVTLEETTYEDLKNQPSTRIKAVMSRDELTDAAPLLYGLIFRYRILTDPTVKADIPRWTLSDEYTEMGYIPILESFPMWFDSLVSPHMGDMFEHVERGIRFKLTNIQPNEPKGKITSWDCNARRVQDDEPLMQVP